MGAIKCMRHFQSVPMTWVKNQISIFPGIINTCKFGFEVDLLLFHFFIFYFAFLLLLVSGQEKNVHVQKKKRVKVVLGTHFSLDITPIINKHLRQCFNLLFLCSKASKSFNRPATHPVKKKQSFTNRNAWRLKRFALGFPFTLDCLDSSFSLRSVEFRLACRLPQ